MASAGFDIYACSKRFGEMSIDPAEYDKQWWKSFLEPLNNLNCQESNTKRLNPQLTDESLVGRVIDGLSYHHRIITEEKAQAVASAKEMISQLLPLCEFGDFEIMWKAYEDAKKIKSHRERSGSTWTVEMLASYVRRQDVEFTELLVSPVVFFGGEAEELIDKILEKIDISMIAIGGQLRTECDTRMLLDAILHPLCVYYNGLLTIRTEQTLKCDLLPTNKLDYVMCYDNQPIGVVEAKRVGCLIDKSVVQLILQLLSVSVENPNLPYFGLLSDGHSFLCLVVCENTVKFFQKNEDQIEMRLSADFKTLIHNVVCGLLELIQDSINAINAY